jgi:hypothetical protein
MFSHPIGVLTFSLAVSLGLFSSLTVRPTLSVISHSINSQLSRWKLFSTESCDGFLGAKTDY